MPKYNVIVDTSWGDEEYHEITVEADGRSKAMYKAAKIFGYDRELFRLFLNAFKATVKQARDDAECPCYKIWASKSKKEKLRLVFKGTPQYNEVYNDWRKKLDVKQ